MKFDSHSLKRAQKPTKVFQFRDPDNPEFKPDLDLRRYGLMTASAIDERAGEMYRKYVTGHGPAGKDGELDTESALFVPPKHLPLVDGEPVVLTQATCRAVAAVELAQTEFEDQERYTFEDIAMWCVSDHLGFQVLQAANWVAPEEPRSQEAPNLTGGSTPPLLNTA